VQLLMVQSCSWWWHVGTFYKISVFFISGIFEFLESAVDWYESIDSDTTNPENDPVEIDFSRQDFVCDSTMMCSPSPWQKLLLPPLLRNILALIHDRDDDETSSTEEEMRGQRRILGGPRNWWSEHRPTATVSWLATATAVGVIAVAAILGTAFIFHRAPTHTQVPSNTTHIMHSEQQQQYHHTFPSEFVWGN
jgi:hypothetical protein